MNRKRRQREPDKYCPRCKACMPPSYMAVADSHVCWFPCPACQVYIPEGKMEAHKATCDPVQAEKDRAASKQAMDALNGILFGRKA